MKVENNKYDGFTHAQLEEAFQGVRNVEHWKNPIDSCCPASQVEVVKAAIMYFTGTEAKVSNLNDGWYKVIAKGYYLGPCN